MRKVKVERSKVKVPPRPLESSRHSRPRLGIAGAGCRRESPGTAAFLLPSGEKVRWGLCHTLTLTLSLSRGRGDAGGTKSEVKRTLLRTILSCCLLAVLLPLAAVGADLGHGEVQGDGNAATRDLSIGATRVLYEAQQLIDRKEYEKAGRILKKFIEKHPKQDHGFIQFTLANALYFVGNKQESLAHYQAAVRMNPAFGPAWGTWDRSLMT